MNIKKFILKKWYLFFCLLVIAVPVTIFAISLSSYAVTSGVSKMLIWPRQSNGSVGSSTALCVSNASTNNYFVGNTYKSEIDSFVTNKPSGVSISNICVDGSCNSGETCQNNSQDCGPCSSPCALGYNDVTYGGRNYSVTGISNQCWIVPSSIFGSGDLDIGSRLALSSTQGGSTSTPQKWDYDNGYNSYYPTYADFVFGRGALYQWHQAMGLPSSCDSASDHCASSISAKHRGICPSGWHIPTVDDANTLFQRSTSTISTYFKAVTNSNGNSFENGGLCNGGSCSSSGTHYFWLSSTSTDQDLLIIYGAGDHYISGSGNKSLGASVRCIRNVAASEIQYTLSYSAYPSYGGSISGNTSQTVNYEGNGSAVTAVPSPGYKFNGWNDGSLDNPRTDTTVTSNISVSAYFIKACPDNIVDSRDGYTYSVQYVNGLCWTAENMHFLPGVTCQEFTSKTESMWYVYNYSPWFLSLWCSATLSGAKDSANWQGHYGTLYNFTAAQNACPDGWRLPTRDEIINNLTPVAGIGGYHIKYNQYFTGGGLGGNGDNSLGFNGFPGGDISKVGGFEGSGTTMYFWTSSILYNQPIMYSNTSATYLAAASYAENGYSVRCVKSPN